MSTVGLSAYLRNYSGALHSRERSFILAKHLAANPADALPTLWYKYLGSLGYTGTLPERMKAWAGALTGNTKTLADRMYALKDIPPAT